MRHTIQNLLILSTVAMMVTACSSGDSSTSYSVLASGQTFKQATVNSKVDLLWVVDNSGSMQPLQQNMTNNFNSFISQFVTKGYDFHLAVTGTDAYKADSMFQNNSSLSRFRDGSATHSGIFQVIPSTANLINTFVTNASLGMTSSGDERAFSSFRSALESTVPENAGFLRSDSFFAIIILSDEDDFSNPTRAENTYPGGDHNYAQAGLESVDSFRQYLDTKTNTTGAFRRYSVSAITVMDQACQNLHVQQAGSSTIGVRYMDLVQKTDGVIGSVCDASYATSLTAIQQHIIERTSEFFLTGNPIPESIRVSVAGVAVPADPTNGWSYNPAANSIFFHGTSVPSSGANVGVTFDPVKVTF